MNECMHEWMNEWMNEQTNKQTNEWMNLPYLQDWQIQFLSVPCKVSYTALYKMHVLTLHEYLHSKFLDKCNFTIKITENVFKN